MRNSIPILLTLTALLLPACGAEPASPPPEAAPVHDSPAAFLDAQAGKVVVLVLGMDGCAKTMAASRALVAMAPDLPADVAAARIDVPPPGGSVEAVEGVAVPEAVAFG